jgi:GT2 family glycosyltransferase
VLERASLVIANSDYTKDLVTRAAPQAHVEAIPLGVDIHRFAAADRESAKTKFGVAGKRVLCTVSRIESYKAHDTVLRAISKLEADEREQFVYLIVGSGPHEQELRKVADALGIGSLVRWIGFISEEDLPEVYSASDLFVLCTRHALEERAVEGFGLVFLEAQACGTPVVGSRTGGIPDAIREGQGGWLVAQDDTAALRNILSELVRHPDLFLLAGKQARDRVVRECSWEHYGERFALALRKAGISDARPPAPETTFADQPQNQGISVVVPTLNRGSYLINTLHDLLAQKHRPLEILVVDQSKAEDCALRNLVRQHPEVISYHKVAFRGLPLARNYGWQRAQYEAIIFVDDDIRCGPSLVSEHLRGLLQPDVGLVAGAIDEGIPLQKTARLTGYFNSWTATPVRNFGSTEEGLVRHAAGCNFSAWRAALEAAGGFDEALAVGAALYEETELCLRVKQCGLQIYFNGNARVQHLAAGNGGCRVPDLPKYIWSLAHNRALLIERHLEWFKAPVAYLRLFLLFVSYAAAYHSLKVFQTGIAGFWRGSQAGKQPPLCGDYKVRM